MVGIDALQLADQSPMKRQLVRADSGGIVLSVAGRWTVTLGGCHYYFVALQGRQEMAVDKGGRGSFGQLVT